MQKPLQQQDEIFRRRLPIVIAGLVLTTLFLVGRVASLQYLTPEVTNYLESLRNSGYSRTLRLNDARGIIYDRGMQTFAVNTLEYRIGISPNLVAEPRRAATQLAALLGLDELETYEKIISSQPWVMLAPRVSADVGQQITQLDYIRSSLDIQPVSRRSYPQGTLAAQIIGFVGGDQRGYYGVEGYYQDQLAGRERDQLVSNIPFDVPQDENIHYGNDVVLTIDRDIQFLAETELQRAINESGSTKGTIIIMNPRNGDILAMASYPTFDPNDYAAITDASLLVNPAIAEQFEPGSIFKVLTMAAALDSGAVSQYDTYVDQGEITIGGVTIKNWNRQAAGVTDMTQVLVQSLNVGVSTIALRMGPTNFYDRLSRFGIGRTTGVDLQGEAAGTLYVPGDTDWSESQLGTNSFGQGVATTPLQMLVAVNAIANDGLMMQPHVFKQLVDGNQVQNSQPSTLSRPISAETAHIVRDMMVAVVRDGLDGNAQVAGYTIAGKTGTAEIPSPVGYEPGVSIASFVGFLPADNPQVSVIVKLDRPRDYWGSQVAAPVFQRLAERLVILLKIPPDDIRFALADEGGEVDLINR